MINSKAVFFKNNNIDKAFKNYFKNISYIENTNELEEILIKQNIDILITEIEKDNHLNRIFCFELNNLSEKYSFLIVYLIDDLELSADKLNDLFFPNFFIYTNISIQHKINSVNFFINNQRKNSDQNKNKERLFLATQVMELLNQPTKAEDIISDILFIIKEMNNFDTAFLMTGKDFSSILTDTPSKSIIVDFKNFAIDFNKQHQSNIYNSITEKSNNIPSDYLTYGGTFWSNDISKTIAKNIDKLLETGLDKCAEILDNKSIAIIPLKDNNEIIALIYIGAKKLDAFQHGDIAYLERISSSIGISLGSRKLYEKVLKYKIFLERSMQIGKMGSWVNPKGEETYHLSKEAAEIFGFSQTKVLLKDILDATHPDDRELVRKTREIGRKNDTSYTYDFRIISNGEIKYINISALPISSGNETKETAGIIQDITLRKNNELKIKESEELLNSILAGIDTALLFIDAESLKVTFANLEAERLFKMPKNDIIGTSSEILLKTDFNSSDSSNKKHFDTTIELKDGTITPIMQTIIDICHKNKKHYAVVMFDMTEQKMLERKLSIAQKMESIGHLAAGIAHEINTPMQYIGDNTRFLENILTNMLSLADKTEKSLNNNTSFEDIKKLILEGFDEIDYEFIKSEAPLAFNQTLEGIQRVTTIVQAMKTFSHPGTEEKMLVNINTSLQNTITVARNEWKYTAKIETYFDTSDPFIFGHSADLNQVFLNLLVNSVHAIHDRYGNEGGGVIKISTETIEDKVIIKFSDNGCGIPEKIKNKIFDPFFTTKQVGSGTGQGLSICHSIIKDKHLGSINFDSKEGVGTVFTIELPLANT